MVSDLALNLMFYIPLAVWLFSTFFFYYKYDKEYRVSFPEKYFKKRASEDPAAVVSFLIDPKGLGRKDFYATAIDMMQKGYLAYDGEFSITNDNFEGLLPHQASLLEKLASKKGDDPDYLTGWIFLASQDAKEFGFYEPQSFVKNIGILGSIFYTAIGVVGILLSHKFRFFLLFVISIITFLYMRKIDKRTKTAQADFERWMGLKRFLSDYNDEEELDPSVLPFVYSMGILSSENECLQKKCQSYVEALDRADAIIL